MNILVTGGAGFIGSHLVKRLLEAGHTVWTLDDLSTGRYDYLDDVINDRRHSFIHGSITDRRLVRQLISRSEAVFHLAAVLGVKNTVENPLKVIEGNIDGTRYILEEAFAKHKKVILASTSEIYGKNNELPFREDSNRVLGDPSIHRWCYATAKAIDEHLAFSYADKGLPVTIVRYFNTYGPRQTASQYGGVIPRFIRAALAGEPLTVYGDGNQSRCFTYIDDTVSGTVATLRRSADGLAFNIGSEEPIAIKALAHVIRRLVHSSSPVEHVPYEQVYGEDFEDMHARVPDISRAKTILNYEPTIDLLCGLKKTIDWHRQQHPAV